MAMNRVVWHHTGGGYTPNPTDLRAYHLLIGGDGLVYNGLFPISANAPGRPMTAGTYAAHTRGLNTGAIGISVCAMAGAKWSDIGLWSHPIKPAQVDALVRVTAALCIEFGISPDRRSTLSHAEVEPTLGIKQASKWDFDYPVRGRAGGRDPIAIGDELRKEVRLAMSHLPADPSQTRPVLRQGATGKHVRDLQRALGGVAADGAFGPTTRTAVVAFQRRKQLLPDGIVGRMTWAALAI